MRGSNGGDVDDVRAGGHTSSTVSRVTRDKEGRGLVVRVDADKEKGTVAIDRSFDKVAIATGQPINLPCPTDGSVPVHQVRTLQNAREVNEAVGFAPAPAAVGPTSVARKNVVIVGMSFVAVELASHLCRKHNVTTAGMESTPLEPVCAKVTGAFLKKRAAQWKVPVHPNSGVTAVTGGAVHFKALESGRAGKLDADIVLLGIGVRPDNHLLSSLPGSRW